MDSYRWHTVLATLSAGGLAGCVALGMIHPVDVIKSRIQALPIDATKEEHPTDRDRSHAPAPPVPAPWRGWRALA